MPEDLLLPDIVHDPLAGFIKVRVFGLSDAADRLAALFEIVPPAPLREMAGRGGRLAAIGPNEWMVSCARADAADHVRALEACLDGLIHLVVEISAGRSSFLLRRRAAETLVQLSPFDLSEPHFAEHQVARTLVGDISALITRTADVYRVTVDQSRASALLKLLAYGCS